MSDNKKYYYLKLKDNFFDSEEMIILQSMQDGYLYSDILIKIYLRSLKNKGKLMFKDLIPYTPELLATVVRHQVGTVEKALKIFHDLGLIEILDNGTIYMLEIQNFIGTSSTEADRKREYRNKIEDDKKKLSSQNILETSYKKNGQMSRQISGEMSRQISGEMSRQISDKNPPEIEIEIEKEIEIEIEKEIESDLNLKLYSDREKEIEKKGEYERGKEEEEKQSEKSKPQNVKNTVENEIYDKYSAQLDEINRIRKQHGVTIGTFEVIE